MADKELRIKYILDKSQFDAAAKDANKTLQDTGKHLKDGTDAAAAMRGAMMQLVGVQSGMAAVQMVVGAIGSSMKEAADYTKRVAEAFGVTRDAMREIAAIQGKGLTNEFVQGQIDVAKQAKILSPQEMLGGTLAFQQYGSAYIGEQGKDQGSRISQTQLDELLPSVFAAAKVQGVEQDAAGTIFAKIVQAMPAHSKTADYKDTFAKVLEMAKNSSGSATLTAKNLAPFFSENVGEGLAFEPTMEGIMSATKVVSTVSESQPAEAGNYSRQMIQDLNRIEIKGKDNDFGIDDDMTVEQKIKAIADKWTSETGRKVPFQQWYSKKLGGRGGNIHATAALTTLITKGIDGGFFAAMEDRASKVSGGTLDAALAAHLDTAGGQANARDAQAEITKLERGKVWDPIQGRIKDASTELEGQGEFETYHAGAAIQATLFGGSGDANRTMATERAMRKAQAEASQAGVNAYTGPDALIGGAMNAGNMTDLAMREEIKRLVDLTAQANAQRARQVPAVPAPMNGKPNVAAQMPR